MTGVGIRRGNHPPKTETQKGEDHVKMEVEKGVMLHTLTKAWSSQKLLEPPLGTSKRASPPLPQHLDLALLPPRTVGEHISMF